MRSLRSIQPLGQKRKSSIKPNDVINSLGLITALQKNPKASDMSQGPNLDLNLYGNRRSQINYKI